MPCHPDRVRENYRCPECGTVTLEPHEAHIYVPVGKIEVHYPERVAVIRNIDDGDDPEQRW